MKKDLTIHGRLQSNSGEIVRKKREGLFAQVYEIVRKIPKGKVTTYGIVALKVGTHDARKVGWALHANQDLETPCHRVVNKDGALAKSYAFGGWEKQKEKLVSEGVVFTDETHVNFEKCLWN